MLLRVPLAAVIGGGLWFLETLLTYYADMFSVLFAGIFGGIVSGFLAMVVAVLFMPIMLTRAWDIWRKFGLVSVFVLFGGIVFAVIARLPDMLQPGIDPEFGTATVYTAHPWFALAAWLSVIVAIVVMPFIGFSDSKRWI